jgi:hypothetical protein
MTGKSLAYASGYDQHQFQVTALVGARCLSNAVRGECLRQGARFAAKHGDWVLVAEQRELPGGWLPSQREEPEGLRPCR